MTEKDKEALAYSFFDGIALADHNVATDDGHTNYIAFTSSTVESPHLYIRMGEDIVVWEGQVNDGGFDGIVSTHHNGEQAHYNVFGGCVSHEVSAESVQQVNVLNDKILSDPDVKLSVQMLHDILEYESSETPDARPVSGLEHLEKLSIAHCEDEIVRG